MFFWAELGSLAFGQHEVWPMCRIFPLPTHPILPKVGEGEGPIVSAIGRQ